MIKIKTKIIATIGPASINLRILKEFYKEKVDILRINTKYVSFKEFKKLEEKIKKAGKFKIMIDIKERNLIEKYLNSKIDYLAVSFAEKKVKLKK